MLSDVTFIVEGNSNDADDTCHIWPYRITIIFYYNHIFSYPIVMIMILMIMIMIMMIMIMMIMITIIIIMMMMMMMMMMIIIITIPMHEIGITFFKETGAIPQSVFIALL